MRSTENRDFFYTLAIQKYIALFPSCNEVFPLHKHLNSGSGKTDITKLQSPLSPF